VTSRSHNKSMIHYADLHCKTNFSFLEGASHADELVRQAAALDYRALAITDRNSLAGVVRAHIAAKEVGLQLIVGAEITPIDTPPVVLWPTDRAAYGRLCRLITRGRRNAPKGECRLTQQDVAEFAEGILAGIVWDESRNSRVEIPENNRQFPRLHTIADSGLSAYADIFSDRCYLLAELHRGPDDCARREQLQRLAQRMGISEAAAKIIECVRGEGPFISIDSFARRTGIGQSVIKRLAQADAFRSLEVNRRQALWQSLAKEKQPRRMPLFSDDEEIESLPAALPAMQLNEEVVADYRSARLSLRAHPISFYRRELDAKGITPAKKLAELENGVPVRVAGLVIGRQRPGTAKGITFVTLEDESGTINLVVHQRTWNRYHRVARRASFLIAHGQLQTTKPKPVPPGSLGVGEPQLEGGHGPHSHEHVTPVIHVVVRHLEVLAEKFGELGIKSRDFR
jgi:DNA polymerase III alpha subunit